MDSKNFAIGVLSITAVILLVGLIVVNVLPAPAHASGMAGWAKEYTYYMAVGQLQSREEQVYVIDAANSLMNVYSFDMSKKTINLDQSISLSEMRDFAAGAVRPAKLKKPNRP